ncbi:hypothetical protein pEaSNUABM37_00095 [Erwinia phage pEa_SNUABM_37]|nr:hypothetical protein pEaSNUABM37_00095 [Erwinia phage pEa_SNUABM_37]QXO10565.1 hypothetical protein pEaSNUABM48_00095 [Erwinia phage pEa_SNUABM_48]
MSSPNNLREHMRPAMGAAILRLIGGEEFTLCSPNTDHCTLLETPPADMHGFGPAVIHVAVDNYPFSVYAQYIDERCRELFGFGLVREGITVSLKRRKNPSDSSTHYGYAYGKDSQGRMMIRGDYGNELNIAYMKMLEEPMKVLDTVPYSQQTLQPYVYNNTAFIYLSDLEALAKWCGDTVVIEDGMASIKSECPL